MSALDNLVVQQASPICAGETSWSANLVPFYPKSRKTVEVQLFRGHLGQSPHSEPLVINK